MNHSPTTFVGPLINGGGDLVIGKRSPQTDSFSTMFIGALDDVRIYNRVLTDEEIATLVGN